MLSKAFAAERLTRAAAAARASVSSGAASSRPAAEAPASPVASTPVASTPAIVPFAAPADLRGGPLFIEQPNEFRGPGGRKLRIIDAGRQTLHRPTTLGKALLAQDYAERYGVEIFIVPRCEALPAIVGESLASRRGNFAVGFVVLEGAEGGHAFAILLSRRDGVSSASAFNSTGRGGASQTILESLRGKVARLQWVEASLAGWQADTTSCHTDAMVLLKDMLRRPDPAGDLIPLGCEIDRLPIYAMPSHLLKTAQRSSALGLASPSSVSVGRDESGRPKTLKDHRDRHTCDVAVEPRPGDPAPAPNSPVRMNVYLQIKGSRFAQRAAALRANMLEAGGETKLREVWDARVLHVKKG